MTFEDARLINEMTSLLISCLSKEKGKSGCLFWNTPMCDGIKICSSCSLRIEEEGEQNEIGD